MIKIKNSNIRFCLLWAVIISQLLSSCTVKFAKSAYTKEVPGSKGVFVTKPYWEVKESGLSQAAPYLFAVAGGAGGYFLSPKTSTTSTAKLDTARFGTAIYSAIGSYVVTLFLKKFIVKGERTKAASVSDSKEWVRKFEDGMFKVYASPPPNAAYGELYIQDKGIPDVRIPYNDPVSHITFEPIVLFSNQLFPSFIISTVNSQGKLAEYSGSLGIKLRSPYAGLTIRYEIECNEKFFDKVQGEYTFKESNKDVVIYPKIPWKISELCRHDQSAGISITYKTMNPKPEKNGVVKASVPKIVNPTLRNVGDCLYGFVEDGEVTKLHTFFAAYVNEEHPDIDKLTKKGLDKKYVDAWTGTPKIRSEKYTTEEKRALEIAG